MAAGKVALRVSGVRCVKDVLHYFFFPFVKKKMCKFVGMQRGAFGS